MSKPKHIYSFDIFDTCIVRSCGSPDNFLQLLSFRVFKQTPSDIIRRLFILDRIQAERKACSNNPYANIYDIYKHLDFSHHSLPSKEELTQIEIDLQKEVARPVLHVKKQIDLFRGAGGKIIFVSDMYLPEAILREILKKYGFLQPCDHLYVSCVAGRTKADGSLFRYIKDKENLSYRKWHHYGDNAISDNKIPAHLGIKTHAVLNPYSMTQKEWLCLRSDCSYDYPSILAGISRSLILSTPNNKRNHLILDLIAPLYCSFAHQILLHARKNNINKLYFCSRDTAQLYQVALKFKQLFPEIKMFYLYISRDSLQNTSETTLINYFVQEGLACHDSRCAIVDSNTTGRTVYLINNLLNKYKYNPINRINIINYHTNNLHTYLYNYDFELDYWLFDYYGSLSSFIFPVLVEAVFSANTQQKTITYIHNNDKITPVFDGSIDDDSLGQPTPSSVEEHQWNLLSQYVDFFISHNIYIHSDSILNQIAVPSLLQFINTPNKDILQALDGLSFNHQGTVTPIVELQSFRKLLRSRGRNTLWPRGTVLYNLPDLLQKLFIEHRLKHNPLI